MPKGAEKVKLVEERNLIDRRNQNLRFKCENCKAPGHMDADLLVKRGRKRRSRSKPKEVQ